ncbi:hypothetical protein AVEN_157694-1 [Araneus ventricosus]|uniref:Uncharacterized protein n=1 Tax=Araneus ventricosus TaxID=182803 RepID=A0A4Y2K4R3_ARAVE|nr:hypothetical protein AVEN_75108-1 [Araneus ventricosus]GBM97703.1 hypothetical protein AVEN_25762-1 [Araneus ventricosus]GBM97769.1 hypothetical protein AVEN_144935-1 [Araneus ventricosus]GBM97782.1 hypothetical protein AVEN_157694-1 [Araneus ventricosus]
MPVQNNEELRKDSPSLIEPIRAFPRLEGVHRAEADEHERVDEPHQVRGGVRPQADEHVLLSGGVHVRHCGTVVQQPRRVNDTCEEDGQSNANVSLR